ncbi:MAG TPA: ABC transporter substrate-binding protein [Chloroflexota bacterium]|nr:ABC transporter substrate-binding protein [Chloroflexota bacterium]
MASAGASAKPAASAAAASGSAASAKPAASVPAPNSSGLEAISEGVLPPDAFQWDHYVAEQQGLYAKNGLAVTSTQLGTPATAAQAVTAGSVNIAAASGDAFIQAIENGAAISIVGQDIGDPAFTVITQPSITSWDQMKGATVAVSTATDGAANIFRLMAKAKGLEAQKDYSFVPVGTTPARYAALKAGQVKAAIMTEALAIQAQNDGFKALSRSDEVLPKYTFIVLAVNKAWGQGHKDAVTKYLTSLSQAVDWLYDPANKQAAINLLKDKAKISDEVAAKTYQVYVEQGQGRILTKGAKIDPEGLKNSADILQSLGMIKTVAVDQWIDQSYGNAVK